jgi:hypothetical protein
MNIRRMTGKIFKAFSILHAVLKAEKITLEISGGEEVQRFYNYCNKPHPSLKFIKNKKWLVALLKTPENIENYRNQHKSIQYDINKAVKRGYTFKKFQPLNKIDDIFLINKSAAFRQNKKIADHYTDKYKLEKSLEDAVFFYGIFSPDDVLKAYCHTPVIDGIMLISRILGHSDNQKDGIMFLLFNEIIKETIKSRDLNGYPDWIMYDSFLGATEGLTVFKQKLGFLPYNVTWKLRKF